MTCRRILAAGVSQALLLIALGAAASGAAAAPPTTQQLRDAATQVQTAQQQLAQVQLQAEQATEAYNGAQVRAAAAAAARTRAAAAMAAAQQEADAARQASDAAAAAADAAAVAADRAAVDEQQAVQLLTAAQQQLDGLLSGAYRSGGNVPMYSALLGTDPLAFATGRQMLDVAGQRQRETLDVLGKAREAADAANQRATAAKQSAGSLAEQAAQRAAAAASAAAAAAQAASAAAAAAATADLAAAAATDARRQALSMVDMASRALGSASTSAQGLQAAATAAQKDAEDVLLAAGGGSVMGGSPAAATAIAWAYKEIGVPYAWGGGNPSGPTLGFAQGAGTVGFDCSGLTQFAYAKAGIALDHYTGSQWNEGLRIPTIGDLLPGDLVFFATNLADPATIHHVALYIGNGLMIQAPHTGDVVRVSPLWQNDFIGGVRPGA